MVEPPGAQNHARTAYPNHSARLSFSKILETTKIHSVCGLLAKRNALVTQRPFRSPHHTISDAGMIGGGSYPRPGEVSLAHFGILFLDEMVEFKKNVLEMLRQPLEDGSVSISRASMSLTYPATFMLVAAMNPCPCGYLGDSQHQCTCAPSNLERYRNRLSGPLLDRIDLHVEVPRIPYQELSQQQQPESSASIRSRVEAARTLQHQRFSALKIHSNSQMEARHIREFCPIDTEGDKLLEMVTDRLGLSARSYARILKVARTIADLAGAEDISRDHLSEAVQYRSLDRKSV